MKIAELKNLLSQFQSKITDKEIVWTLPTDLEHGILTTNIAFTLAKELRQNPNVIAQNISDELNEWLSKNVNEKVAVGNSPLEGWTAKQDGVDKSDALQNQNTTITSKPIGAYINIIPTESFYIQTLTDKLDKEALVSKSSTPVMLEYVSTNVAKKIHAGHMRNCNIGEALRRILSLKYSDILTDNHWGDWGVNMGVLIWGYKNFPEEKKPNNPSIDQLTDYYVWANNQKDIVNNWEVLVRDEFLKLEQKEDSNYKFWQESIKESKNDASNDLDLLSVRPHDLNQGESYYGPDMDTLNTWMEKRNIWKTEGQARYFDFEKLTESWLGLDENTKKQISKLGRSYMISSNGYTSYCFRDVAARWQWARDHKREIMITLTDKTQNHVITQAFAIISYISQLPEFAELGKENIEFYNLVNVAYGFLKLPEGKMSTRTGNVLLLRDLFAQVQDEARKSILSKNENNPEKFSTLQLEDTSKKLTVAALKWNDLKQSYEQDIIFDINQVLNFVGNTGVYQLYTYARLNSVLKKLNSEKLNEKDRSIPNFGSKAIPLIVGWQAKPDGVDKSDANNNGDVGIAATTMNLTSLNTGTGSFASLKMTTFNPLEQAILKQMWTLPEVVESICDNYQIHLLTNHLYELSNLVNKWYNDVPILKDPRQEFMQTFITKIMEHLKFSLDLLGIEVVEEI